MPRTPFILQIFTLHFALCTLHFSSFAHHGLSIKPYSHELKFSHLTAEDGLSQSVVNCIYQDARGFMWFGTQDGLNKYDGYKFTIFKHDPQDSNSISNNYINSLYEDAEGILWIGTNGGGLNTYDRKTNTFWAFKSDPLDSNSLSDNRVRQVVEDKDGILWIATNHGLNSYNKETGRFTRYYQEKDHPDFLQNDMIFSLFIDMEGTLWIGTKGGGLHSYDKQKKVFRNYQDIDEDGNPKVKHSNWVKCILEDRSGTLWVGTDGGGLCIFDRKKQQWKYYKNDKNDPYSLSNNRVFSICQSTSGKIWVATLGGGINIYDSTFDGFLRYMNAWDNPKSLNDNFIRCIYEDNASTIWIGTGFGGINAYHKTAGKFRHFQKVKDAENSIKNNTVYALMHDSDGLLWIGTGVGGLSTYNSKTGLYKHYDKLSTARNNTVLSLCEDRDGIIWVGTYGDGLNAYNKKTKAIRHYSQDNNSLSNNTVLCIYEDHNGLLWIGTYRGLNVFDKKTGTFKIYTEDDGLAGNIIYCVYQDEAKTIWIGTDGGGLSKLDPNTGEIKNYLKERNKNSISSNAVNCIYDDHMGFLWLGTTNGLNKFNVKTGVFTHFYERDGLPNDYIYGILPDKNGNLWMSTNKGISRATPGARGSIALVFRNYDANDGLQSNEFNQGAYFLSNSGQMYFGGINGFNIFYPDEIKDNAYIPPIVITSFKIFGKNVKLDTSIINKRFIELSYKDDFFSFEFVALNYIFPSKNQYSYKLEGFDKGWTPAALRRYASYTNLSGGDYIFKVRGANNDGLWNEEGAMIHIRVIPPFWKTKLFYTLCILLGIIGVFSFIKLRTRQIEKEKKILEAKVAERTRELAQKNKDITDSINYAKQIQDAILPSKDLILKQLKQAFILYKPKDIVSGDFYWFGERDGKKIIAAVDCTGHGVPGAFMSMIGHNLLNQIVIKNKIVQPAEILNKLNEGVQEALKQGTWNIESNDGMDVAICSIEMVEGKGGMLEFAGANNPLYLIRNKNLPTGQAGSKLLRSAQVGVNGGGTVFLEKINGDKFPIGGSQVSFERNFTNHTIKVGEGDTIYLFSDGYVDQFGGPRGKKFMAKRFQQLLIESQNLDMSEQEIKLNKTIENWRGTKQDQVDDVLVIGVRF